VTSCICRALTELVCSTDPEEETRIRRTPAGIQIECWRRVATILVPDNLPPGPSDVVMAGAMPDALRDDESLELPSSRQELEA
jgi:hypothetical protein